MKFVIYISILFFSIFCLNVYSQNIQNQQNGIYRICKGKIRDSDKGKSVGYYDHNEKTIMTLAMPGAKNITLSFKSFCTEKDNDILKIYDGKDTNATLIGSYSGSVNPGNITSSDSFITLYFVSDKSVSCSGWEADVINNLKVPTATKITVTASPICYDTTIGITLDFAIPCDSLNANNTKINGSTIKYIMPLNCANNKASKFKLGLKNPVSTNGTYTITHKHGYRDYCDSVYQLSSSQIFTISNCPIFVDIKGTKDTICLGECISLSANISGGNSSKYVYNWTPKTLSGKGPFNICPTVNTKYKLTVSDGVAIPGTDSIQITVLQPPIAPKDTQVCYFSSNLFLKGFPSGGKWYGSGIVNSMNGEFKPYGQWGDVKVWYQIGGCADTMIINVSYPYNYDNVFCPGKTALPVVWYGPLGGTWTGLKITKSGMFTPDSAGKYVLTYTWKGCVSQKNVIVQNVTVPHFDTTCESKTLDTLKFKPYGIYPYYFPGQISAYYGWYNPSLMGGPGNRNIIFTALGGCTDTTKLTILPCYAGKDDTICPSTNNFNLLNIRYLNTFNWTGKGVKNPKLSIYDASWTNGKNGIDTLVFKSGKCIDYKIIKIIGTALNYADTLDVCNDADTFLLSNKIPTNVPNGTWIGTGVINGLKFAPRNLSSGNYNVSYSKNGCSDNITIRILTKAAVPTDTNICIQSKPLELIPTIKGSLFWGTGMQYGSKQEFNPFLSMSGKFKIHYLTPLGCTNFFYITVDSMPIIIYNYPTKTFCFKDSSIVLTINPLGGRYEIDGILNTSFNPGKLNIGNHKLMYSVNSKSCFAKDSFNIVINDSIHLLLSPNNDSLCKGEMAILQSTATGGVGNYTYWWSNGQSGYKTIVSPKTNIIYTCYASDGCSNIVNQNVNILVHPVVWSNAFVNPPVCYGKNGYVYLSSGNGNPMKKTWNYPGKIFKDTFYAPSGSFYKVFLIDSITKCFSDTTIYLPGFAAIKAQFAIQQPINPPCYTPEEVPLTIFNATTGATKGTWYVNSSPLDTFISGLNPIFNADFKQSKYNIKLSVENPIGCKDTAEIKICYKDTVILYIPTAFTPNNDGLNDVLQWTSFGCNEIGIIIYNRWGEIIHKSNELNGIWDGKINGNDCQEGVYVVYVEYKGLRFAKKTLSQSVLLLRNINK